MSTRCQVIFEGYEKDKFHDASVYRHSDGYPDSEHGVLATLVPFAKDFMANRGHDPEYMTAHLVALWINNMNEHNAKQGYSSNMFKYTGHGVCGFKGELHGDLDYLYVVKKTEIEVRRPVNEFWDEPTVKNTKVIETVKII